MIYHTAVYQNTVQKSIVTQIYLTDGIFAHWKWNKSRVSSCKPDPSTLLTKVQFDLFQIGFHNLTVVRT